MRYFVAYILVVIMIIFTTESFSQDANDPVISPSQNSDISSGNDNHLTIKQLGQENSSLIQQSGDNQKLQIWQEGQFQQLKLFQIGDNNQWQINQQGIGHEYDGRLQGDENQINVNQTGSYNSLQQDLLGNGMDYQITQEGSQLELIQIEKNDLAPSYQVHQKGVGMSIIIENGINPQLIDQK